MNWFEFINHIVNLVLPACGVALLLGLAAGLVGRKGSRPAASVWAVSYTHLTLPTKA